MRRWLPGVAIAGILFRPLTAAAANVAHRAGLVGARFIRVPHRIVQSIALARGLSGTGHEGPMAMSRELARIAERGSAA
jgi:hypothetical protein